MLTDESSGTHTAAARPRPGVRSLVAGLWRFTCFLAMSAVVLCLGFAAILQFIPDAAAKIGVYVPFVAQWAPAPAASDPDADESAPGRLLADADAVIVPAAPGADRPTPGRDSSPRPLGTPPPSPGDSRYALMRENTAYDPCRPIRYVTSTENMPDGTADLITAAVAEVSRATGLVFIDEGTTSEPASGNRSAFQPERYGDRWAPLLFIWKTEAQQPKFTSDVYGTNAVGIGGSIAYTLEGKGSAYVTGEVQLNTAVLSRDLSKPGGRDTVRAVIAHELAHVVGLDHVDDPSQLMAPTTSSSVSSFGPGDLTGLALLGSGACIPEL